MKVTELDNNRLRLRLQESNAALKLVYKHGWKAGGESLGEIIDKNNEELEGHPASLPVLYLGRSEIDKLRNCDGYKKYLEGAKVGSLEKIAVHLYEDRESDSRVDFRHE